MALVGPIRIRVQTKPRIRCRVLPRLIPLDATVAIGTVTTLSPGSPATVTNVGTPGAVVLNFGLPAGSTGAAGVVQSVTAGANISVDSTNPAAPVVSATGLQPLDSDLTSWAAITRAAGFDALVAGGTSAQLRAFLTDEVGTGAAYFVGGALGTPASVNLANATNLPNASVVGLGTAALVNTGTSGATVPLLNGNNTHSGSASFTGGLSTGGSPQVTLRRTGLGGGAPVTTGTSGVDANQFLVAGNQNVDWSFGFYTNGVMWSQPRFLTDYSINFGTIFQPNGGNVGIGNVSTTGVIPSLLTVAGATEVQGLLNVSGAAAGQVKFPATQNPSSNANTFDDYAEGTFTPAIIGTGTAGAGTYSIQTGHYIKAGGRVFFDISLTWSAHTGTTNMKVSGLPFTAGARKSPISLQCDSLTFAAAVQGFVEASATTINLGTVATGAAYTALPIDTAATLCVTGSYSVV